MKSVKLTLRDIEMIKHLYINRKVTSMKRLASSFNVANVTIKYYVDPLYNEYQREKSSRNVIERMRVDPEFKKLCRKRSLEYSTNRYRTDTDFKEYIRSVDRQKYRMKHTNLLFRKFIVMVENEHKTKQMC